MDEVAELENPRDRGKPMSAKNGAPNTKFEAPFWDSQWLLVCFDQISSTFAHEHYGDVRVHSGQLWHS